MVTTPITPFSRDILGRYVCNLFQEAMQSADPTASRPDGSPQTDARPFDLIVVGGGSFGSAVAQHLLYNDKTHSHRILVLEAGMMALPEHVQNLPALGLGAPGPITADPGQLRAEVWGLPWRSDVGFPGLAYCIGGRSIFFGGWSPELLEAETTAWPAMVTDDLRNPRPDGSPGYFRQASEQIGVNVTNDFIFGSMHEALRQLLFDGITAGAVTDAIPFVDLPLHLDDVPAGSEDLFKLEAPLAVQGRAPRSGFFPLNKFSTVPLLTDATRIAQSESGGDDVKKRLMAVPGCHVTRLITAPDGADRRVVGVEVAMGTDRPVVPVPPGGQVIIALGTIESARLALTSFPGLQNVNQIGHNLMAHLRSNLTIRIPRKALPGTLPNELQASALFLKGHHDVAGVTRHFHLQITAAGLDKPTTDSEAELFKKVPDIDLFARFLNATDNQVVLTLRGIGEMEPDNPNSNVTLDGPDEFTYPRAFVSLKPNANDYTFWDAMDQAADEAALVFANGKSYEVLIGNTFTPVAAGQAASAVFPFAQRRDGIGTTHHEAGTLRMGTDPATSVTNTDARFHHVTNTYAAGPALHPTVGSPNPMLTGIALARRLGDHLVNPAPYVAEAGFTALFDGMNTDKWRMSTIKNQAPDRSNPGNFIVADGTLESTPGNDLGLYWYTVPTPADFILKLEWLRWLDNGNSGVFVRFPHPDSKGYNNTAYVGVNFGFEVQIDEFGVPDGAGKHKTGAIYNEDNQTLTQQAANPAGQWNEFEIRVQGQKYTVFLNGNQVTTFQNADPARGLPTTPTAPSFIGLQSHFGSRVAFRNIRLKPL